MGPTSLLLGKEVKEFALHLGIIFLSQQKPYLALGLLTAEGKKQTPICFDLVKSQPNQIKTFQA